MTFTINGCGTKIMGARELTAEEYAQWSPYLPPFPEDECPSFYIGTESIVLIFCPVIPFKTYVFYHPDSSHYVPCFYPSNGHVYWPHVKGRWEFYIIPGIVIFYLALFVLALLYNGVSMLINSL